MSKYIRTKDKIYKIDFSRNETVICYFTTKGWVYKSDVIKESDTIEDLCDEFVGIDDWNRHHKIENPNNIEIVKNFLKTFKEKYGAIWNDKGLRYVAKMNENGELELI